MIHFLSVETTIAIHDILIESYGGLKGVRDHGLLFSALEMPKASFDGKHLHPTLSIKRQLIFITLQKTTLFSMGIKERQQRFPSPFLSLTK